MNQKINTSIEIAK